MSAIFATSDPHGHLAELSAALEEAGLIDADGRWSGGDARLWVLGDLLDRGPDGRGVISLVRRLGDEAAAAGGAVNPLLGNHEVIALGMAKFGDQLIDHHGTPRTFLSVWSRNGGLATDQIAIDEDVFAWMAGLPALALDGGHLMMHSDTPTYLEWGEDIETINRVIGEQLASDDPGVWFDLLLQLGQRHEFAGPDGTATARGMLDALGGERIVHGHSIIGDLFDEPCDSYSEPRLYADGLALDIDGGIYDGGPCLVVRLR